MDFKNFDYFFEGIMVVNQTWEVVYANQAMETLADLNTRSLLRVKSLEKILAFEAPILECPLISLRESTQTRELSFETSTGKRGKVQITIQPLYATADSETPLWLLFLRDVTLEERLHQKYRLQLKEKEELIETLNRKLKEVAALYEISLSVYLFKDKKQQLDLLLANLAKVFEFAGVLIFLWDEKQAAVVPRIAFQDEARFLNSMNGLAPNLPLVKALFDGGKPIFTQLNKCQELNKIITKVTGQETANCLLVPFISHKYDKSFMCLVGPASRWQPEDYSLHLLNAISNLMTPVIDSLD